jgi:hypothetical protein
MNLPTLSFLMTGILMYSINVHAQQKKSSAPNADGSYYRDLYTDTWVATDALGRKMPTSKEVGPVKKDHRRVVGMFYITWHQDKLHDSKNPYMGDITKILKADPGARLDAHNPLWSYRLYHWGEPEMGYFLSKDKYVIRKDMSMLSDAGVDVLIMDVTNAVRYWDEWKVVFAVMEEMRSEGNKVPKFCFWAFNGPVITVIQDLYDHIYSENKYKNLWFYWDGKPLLLYNSNPKIDANGKTQKNPNPHYDSTALTDTHNPHYGDSAYTEKFYTDYTKEVKSFFTLRTMWWGFYDWAGKRFIGTEDNWSYGYQMNDKRIQAMNRDDLLSTHNGKKEEAAVTPAQHAPTNLSMVGKSWTIKHGEPPLNRFDLPDSAYVPWLGKTVMHPEGYGIYFQKRWDDAIKADPQFMYVNDWNEWTAYIYKIPNGGTTPFMRRKSNYFFVDQYNAEFNRDIQPMKGGYTDNYYMQMAENIRRYKGARPIPVLKGFHKMKMNNDFSGWNKVDVAYRDTKGDVFHRDYNGYGGLHYTNNSGRNDIVTCKVAVDKKQVYFYAETTSPLTSYEGKNWMLLFIDADKNSNSGWYGYDFLINKNINDKTTSLMKYDEASKKWIEISRLDYAHNGNKLEIAVPRKLLGLKGHAFTFDFHWCDDPVDLKSQISLCINGDSAPNRRFNYRCIWKK